MKKETYIYLIDRRGASLFADGNLVEAENSKKALEKYLKEKFKDYHIKVKKCHINEHHYIVSKSNEKGQVYRDWRTRIPYKIVEKYEKRNT